MKSVIREKFSGRLLAFVGPDYCGFRISK